MILHVYFKDIYDPSCTFLGKIWAKKYFRANMTINPMLTYKLNILVNFLRIVRKSYVISCPVEMFVCVLNLI